MAKNARKLVAWMMVLTMLAGQLALPAAAESTDPPVEVEVSVSVPEAPAASSQAPAPSGSVSVSTSAPSTSASSSGGVTEQSSSTTTTWTDSQGGTSTSGSETTTTVQGTDEITGQTLYEGGTTSGSETSTTTSSKTETGKKEDSVAKEVHTTVENTSTETGSKTTSEETTTTATGQWGNAENGYTEGQFTENRKTDKQTTSETEVLGEETITGEISIDLAPDTKNTNEKEGIYTYTGTGAGQIIPFEENVEIPEGATLVKDHDGNVIGYQLQTTTETITGTTNKEGNAQKTSGSTDTTGSTQSVTPSLDTAANKLNIRIDDNTQIKEESDGSGNVIAYEITNTTEEERSVDAIDQLIAPEAGSFQQEDGTILVRTVENSQDAEGNTVLKITEVKTDANGKEINRSETTQTIIENDVTAVVPSEVKYTLPEKPEGSVTTENGITTTVTVTDIEDDDGNVIGYKTTTVQTDDSGAELYRQEEDLYGTEEVITHQADASDPKTQGSATVKTTVVETHRVTAEETSFKDIETYTRLNQIVNNMTKDTTYEMVEIDGKLYFVYTGTVTVSEGENHGDISLMNPITPMSSLFNKNENLDLDQGNQANDADQNNPAEGFKYIGSGVNTSLTINKDNNSSGVEQFRLISSDNKVYYAMCIDFNTYIQAGHLYDIEDIREATYLQQSGNEDISAAEKIRSVALNGYWGTESGVGSMADVQSFLKDYLKSQGKSEKDANEIINALTPGQAQAATQAALWMFGNKDKNNVVNTKDLVGGDNNTDETMVKYLFNALLASADDPNAKLEDNEGVEFLDAEDITAASIVVKEKSASADDADNTTGKNVYNTDLNFTLGIEPAKLFGDLKVTVYDNNGKEVKTVILANQDKTLIGLKPDANGMYTISDIEIAEGVTVNLKLHGTQDLGTGVYIYTSLEGTFNDSQTLVTLASGARKVDLDITMKLDVQEPTVTKTTSGKTQYGTRTDTQKQTRTDEITRKTTTTKTQWETVTTEETESDLIYTADVSLTSVSTKETKEEKRWSFSWMKTYDPDPAPLDDDFPIPSSRKSRNSGNTEKLTLQKTLRIIDEPVPLAKAPKTGDLSGIWAVLSGLSLGGMALLNAKRKEEE